MQKSAWIVTIAMFIAVPAAAQTGFPDLRGTWKGDSESIVADAGNAHHPGAANSGTRLDSVTFTMKVDQQDGRRVSGTYSSQRATEPIIGVISRTGAIHFVDTDGYATGALLGPDRLEMCYLQIGPAARVASCTEMTRQP
jgi:hypothetical protein